MRIAILYNEPTLSPGDADYASEAGVLESVEAFGAALTTAGHAVTPIGIHADLAALVTRLSGQSADIVVNFCEGFAGQSRGEVYIAGLLELAALRYTGSPPEALALALDKVRTKQILSAASVPTAPFWVVGTEESLDSSPVAPALRERLLQGALFVKPAHEDASLGIDQASVAMNWAELASKVKSLQSRYGDVLVEPFLDGREFNVGVVALAEPRVLPIAEIDFHSDSKLRWPIVTYEGKWAAESRDCRATPVRCPAVLDDAWRERIEHTALAAFQAIGCRDYARVDVRLTRGGELFVLEVNTNPDAGPSAGLARALAAAGITYDDFACRLVETAAGRRSRPKVQDPKSSSSDVGTCTLHLGPEVTIRPLRADDCPALLALLEACRMFRSDEIEVAGEILEEAIRDGAEGHYRVWVATCDGRAIGWSCHGRVPLTDATFDLYWIAVHPDFQGRRAGQRLLREIERSLRQTGARWLLAETSSSAVYDKTRRFYERAGFVVVGDLPDFYRSGDGRITFAKRID